MSKAEFAEPSLKPGKPFGIVWQGPWSEPYLSMDQVGRRMIRSIERAGMPVSLPLDLAKHGFGDVPSQALKELGCEMDHEAMEKKAERSAPGTLVEPIYKQTGPLATLLDRILVTVHHVPMYQQRLRSILYPQSYQYVSRSDFEALHRFKILFTAIERDRLTGGEADEVKKFGQVWVPCKQNAEAMIRSGIPEENVRIVPHPMPIERHAVLSRCKASGRGLPSTSTPDRPYFFYSIGKWEPRKNQMGLMRAFLRSFKPDGSRILLLKTSRFSEWKGYPESPFDGLKENLQDPSVIEMGWTPELAEKFVKINASYISEDGIVKLHSMGDCYLSASHGEGWDMPAFDAMVAGSHIVSPATGWMSDHPEIEGSLMTKVNSNGTEPCHRGYGWGISRWMKIEDSDLSSAMVAAADGSRSGVPGSTFDCVSSGYVGSLVVSNICDLVGMTMEEMQERWAK